MKYCHLKLPPAVCVPSTRSRGKGTREKSSVAGTKGEAIGSSSREEEEEEEHTN